MVAKRVASAPARFLANREGKPRASSPMESSKSNYTPSRTLPRAMVQCARRGNRKRVRVQSPSVIRRNNMNAESRNDLFSKSNFEHFIGRPCHWSLISRDDSAQKLVPVLDIAGGKPILEMYCILHAYTELLVGGKTIPTKGAHLLRSPTNKARYRQVSKPNLVPS